MLCVTDKMELKTLCYEELITIVVGFKYGAMEYHTKLFLVRIYYLFSDRRFFSFNSSFLWHSFKKIN